MKTKKRFFALALCSAFLILASVVGATAAWFTSSASVTGNAKTGTLSLTVTIGETPYTNKSGNNLTTASKKDNIMPGDSVCDEIKVKVTTTDPNGAYVRVSFTISGAGDINPTLGGNWIKSGNYYYYGTSATALTPLETDTDVTFCSAATLDTNTTSQGNITVTLTVDAVQASNQGGTIAWN